MSIQNQLTLRFSVITGTILILFSLAVYFFSATYRREAFYDRLNSRALTMVRLLVDVEEVDKELLQKIEQHSTPVLNEEQIAIFDAGELQLVYASVEEGVTRLDADIVERLIAENRLEFNDGYKDHLGLLFEAGDEKFIVIASAFDLHGLRKLTNLRNILIIGCVLGIAILIVGGRLFAHTLVSPLLKLNSEISNISAGNLDQHIDPGNRHDEIAQLARNFNLMLSRLQNAFEAQLHFIQNASHELRTPLTAISTQLQLVLDQPSRPKSETEYREVLQSLNEETSALISLTNRLLTLAMSGLDRTQIAWKRFRVDEVIFNAQNELQRLQPDYQFQFEYAQLPENEEMLTVMGNSDFIRIAFINFMENACKYSQDHTVHTSMDTRADGVLITFTDRGKGIATEDLEHIFTPFFRTEKAKKTGIKGFGIGLTLCKSVVDLHNGNISIQSVPGQGSRFTVFLPYTSEL